jgi:hypothetical protein
MWYENLLNIHEFYTISVFALQLSEMLHHVVLQGHTDDWQESLASVFRIIEMTMKFHKTTWHYNPDDLNMNSHFSAVRTLNLILSFSRRISVIPSLLHIQFCASLKSAAFISRIPLFNREIKSN